MDGRDVAVPTSSPPIRVLATPYAPAPRDETLKQRLLAALGREHRWSDWGPAKWSYADLRRELGDRVVSSHFRRLMDDLIAEGLVVEVREPAKNRGFRQHRHVVVQADRWREARWGLLVEVRGREDVLAALGLADPAA